MEVISEGKTKINTIFAFIKISFILLIIKYN